MKVAPVIAFRKQMADAVAGTDENAVLHAPVARSSGMRLPAGAILAVDQRHKPFGGSGGRQFLDFDATKLGNRRFIKHLQGDVARGPGLVRVNKIDRLHTVDLDDNVMPLNDHLVGEPGIDRDQHFLNADTGCCIDIEATRLELVAAAIDLCLVAALPVRGICLVEKDTAVPPRIDLRLHKKMKVPIVACARCKDGSLSDRGQ